MPIRALPAGALSRAAAAGRVAGRIGAAQARRLLGGAEGAAAGEALGQALFEELDQMKGLAMKVGQILSYLDVGLPEAAAARLARLQEGAEPYAPEAIVAIVEGSLGAPIGDLFERFDRAPVAAASLGQVHRARRRGREVAVKVRYPGIEATIEQDFRRLAPLARAASLAAAVDGAALVEDLRAQTLAECDYAAEADSQRWFRRILAGEPGLRVPEVIDDRCSPEVLTTAWHEGVGFEALRSLPADRRAALAAPLARLPHLTLLRRGALQADPHPGNFRFHLEDAAVTALDFGCVRRFTPAQLSWIRLLTEVVVLGRRARLGDALAASGLAPDPGRLDLDEMWAQLRWTWAPYLAPTFRFDRRWWRSGLRYSQPTNPNTRHLQVPPWWLWLQRALLGLHSALASLEVELPLRAELLALLEAGPGGEPRGG